MTPDVYCQGYHVGYTDIARALNEKYPDRQTKTTRQLVHQWSARRDRNGFPGSRKVLAPSGKVKNLYLLQEVLSWYETYTPSRGGRRHAYSPVDNESVTR